MQENIYSYPLGAMTLTIMSEGTLKASAARIFADVDEAVWRPLVETDAEGRFTLGMNIVHVAVNGHSILLDTGFGEPHPLLTNMGKAFPMTQTASLMSCLDEIGVQPDQVTAVIFSHAHGDHIMGATIERDGRRRPTFPKAQYLMMQQEWTETQKQAQPGSAFNVHLETLQNHNSLQLVTGDYEITPGVQIIPSPGESPGHAIIRLDSMGKTAFYVGDLFHHPTEVSHLDWIWPGRDQAQMLASREALVQEALATDALLISAHMLFPGMGKLQQHDNALEWVATEPDA